MSIGFLSLEIEKGLIAAKRTPTKEVQNKGKGQGYGIWEGQRDKRLAETT